VSPVRRATLALGAGLAILAAPAAAAVSPILAAPVSAPPVSPTISASPVSAPTARGAHIADVVVATNAHARPSAGSARVWRVPVETSVVHGPVELLILGSVRVSGQTWLDVRLPIRPNTAHGWISANDVRLQSTPWRIVVELSLRSVEVFRSGRLVRRVGAVVGKPSTPTPVGLFAVYEFARQPASSDLGPWALHLTAHSDFLFHFGGGPGRVAIHGRAGDLLADPLGSALSHGCVRVSNANISWLAHHVQPGTPVSVEG
jgi:lipoprotein-anchoring transpeptidase ErfK/SrfK